jgi:hypothetical protein
LRIFPTAYTGGRRHIKILLNNIYFLTYLTTISVMKDCIALRCLMKDYLEKAWKKQSWLNLRYYMAFARSRDS